MTDFLLTDFLPADAPTGQWGSSRNVDERDMPQPSDDGIETDDPTENAAPSAGMPIPIEIAAPISTRPVQAQIIQARTVTMDAGDHMAMGIEPDVVTAANVFYTLVTVTNGSISIAADRSASSENRFTLYPSEQAHRLEGVAGFHVWANAADVDVSVAVIGSRRQ